MQIVSTDCRMIQDIIEALEIGAVDFQVVRNRLAVQCALAACVAHD